MSIYIAFGSNQALGTIQPAELLCEAARTLNVSGVAVRARSSLWRSPAWPDPSDPPYVNAVASVETAKTPAELLDCLHAIEAQLGRARTQRNAPRTLDLDIIDFMGLLSDGMPGPILPHPRASQRPFVLLPLREISPDWTHPATGEGIDRLVGALAPEDVSATKIVGPFGEPG